MAESLILVAPLLRKAVTIVDEIHLMIQLHGEKHGALKEVESKIEIVNSVLSLVGQNVQSVRLDMLMKVVARLEDLQQEVERVKKMKRIVYVLQAKDCQEKLRSKIDTIQFYLNSLHFNQTNSVCSKIDEIKKLLCQDWESAVNDDTALLDQLEDERREYAEFRSQVETKKLKLQQLQKLGLSTRAELGEVLKQTEEEHQRMLMQTQDAKGRVEAEYLEQVIELLSATEFPPDNDDQSNEKKKSKKLKKPKKSKKSKEPKKSSKHPFDPICGICLERFHDPVILDCECRGTVDKSCFEKWCNQSEIESVGKPNCPLCGLPLQSMRVWPNYLMKEWLEANPLGATYKKPIKRPIPDDGDSHPREGPVKVSNMDIGIMDSSKPVIIPSFRNEDSVPGVPRPDPVPGPMANPDQLTGPVPNPDLVPGPVQNPRNRPFFANWRWLIALTLLVVIAAIVGIVIGVLSGKDKGDEKATSFCPMGLDLDGSAARDFFGWSVALSSDGNLVAIGAPFHQINGADVGHVRIFYWSGSQWESFGSDLSGDSPGEGFGYSVALSSDGNRVAIGAPRGWEYDVDDDGRVLVFEWSGSQWVRVGSELYGGVAGDRFGYSVALSSDGNRVAIGAPYTNETVSDENAGYVRIFHWSGSAWSPVGSNIDGEAAGDRFGRSVALSSDGNIVAIGAPYNDGNGCCDMAGHVRILNFSGSEWIPVGSNIDGEAAGDASGWSVALSSDGSRVAIGAPNNGAKGEKAGHVRVFDWSGSGWVKVGSDMDGEAANNLFGYSVALSSDGNRVAIGAVGLDDSGQVYLFDLSGSQWVKAGTEFAGEAAGDRFGYSVALSSDGNRVAIGGVLNGAGGLYAGHARMFYPEENCV